MISTKGRYAIRVLIDLAEHNNGTYIPAREIAQRQEISPKYLEKILAILVKEKLIDAMHGKGGGCKLNRDPADYTLWEVLCIAETDMSPVACLGENAKPCEMSARCKTLGLWKDYYELIHEFFESKTIADLAGSDLVENYII